MIATHPSEELLVDYASGSLSEALSLAIASHASMCSSCAEAVRDIEDVGGAMLEDCDPAEIDEAALGRLMARLDEPAMPLPSAAAAGGLDGASRAIVPPPLRRYLPRSLDSLPWRRVGRLFEEYRLPLAASGVKAALLRLAPGSLMPRHSHRGQEYTLVLAGGYRDGEQAYGRGDFSAKDPTDQHQPVVDDDGPCICFVALDAPLKLSGPVGVLVNPFLRL
jgi:putative transcriptional regulator